MPSSARKSSLGIGGRRGPQKPHIPYRGDNPEVGKKTGIAVRHVERKSDGFEPFDEIMKQADKRTPPRLKIRKSVNGNGKRGREEVVDDEDGEMSMELDDTPIRYLTASRPPATPRSSTSSTSRAVSRTSNGVDFDQIPSPRSSKNARSNNRGPGPSRLSQTFQPDEIQDDDDDSDGGYGHSGMQINPDYEGEQDTGAYDDYGPEDSVGENHSFSRMDEDEEEEQEQEEQEDREATPTPPQKQKGKEKARAPSPTPSRDNDEDVENGIAQGLMGANLEPHSDDQEDEPTPKPKRVKTSKLEKKPIIEKISSRGKKENKPVREGIRRSERAHIKPLEWWRGEKVVYGLSSTPRGPILVAPIKEIVRIPKEEPRPLRPKKKGRGRSKSAKPEKEDDEEEIEVRVIETENPEEGWDDETESQGVVWDYDTQREVQRRIAWTASMVKPRPAANGDWSFDKIFGDGNFIAAGQIMIPPKKRKPAKEARDNTYVFYVIEGAVNFKIHHTSVVLATGGMFMVPRGNTYLIENISERPAKLFFAQARMLYDEVDDRRRSSAARGSSGGPLLLSVNGQIDGQRSSTAKPAAKGITPAAQTKRSMSSKV